ncbi:MAG: DUF5666 domain-containing protein [Candidatus Acidiferrales bacterium]
MYRVRSILTILALCVCAAFAGCRASGNPFGSSGQSGNSSMVLAMTDTPPSNASILSAEVTLTGATLTPGNVSLLPAPAQVELTRLQTDVAYLATATNIPAGNYTGLTLTFSNPLLTIENDTTSVIGNCAVSAICNMAPTSVANLSTSVTLQPISLAANSAAGLLVDVNLENLLSATLGADFKNGVTASSFTPAGSDAPLVGAEDVVGQVGSVSGSNSTFTLSNAMGSYSLAVDGSTTFFQFPTSACATPCFSCLAANQVVSVDISIRADGTPVARNIVFEDADRSDTEVEGVITGTNVGSQQFSIVTLGESGAVTGLLIGDTATVHYTAAPQTPFDVDFVHADNAAVSTSGYLFAAPTDLSVGQEVSIRRNASSSGNSITADRVRLRSSRITANVQSLGAPNIYLGAGTIPSIFSAHGVTELQAQTVPSTIYYELGGSISSSNITLGNLVSVRGPLFNASGSSTRPMVVTKVVLK